MTPELAAMVLAGCRWLLYGAVLILVGTSGARVVIARLPAGSNRVFVHPLEQRLARSVVWAVAAWLIVLVAVLAANAIAWFGPSALLQGDRLHAMLVQTRWGRAWMWTFLTALLAAVALLVARFVPAVRPLASFAAGIAAIVATPQTGHAAGYGSLVWTLHSAHLLGTGLWLGTLLVLVSHSWPLWREQSASLPALRQLLAAITPVALVGAGIGVASGAGLSVTHVWPPQTAFETAYGTTLALKILMVALVALFGWLNWRRFGRRAERAEGRRQLRASILGELVLAFVVVLMLTAWLSGLPTPT